MAAHRSCRHRYRRYRGVVSIKKALFRPEKEKPPKPPKPPKAGKPAKVKEDKKVKQEAKLVVKAVQAADTLSGKPAVLVPPPPKPTVTGLKPGMTPPPIKTVVPPTNPAAKQNLGATLIKLSNQQQPPKGTPPTPEH